MGRKKRWVSAGFIVLFALSLAFAFPDASQAAEELPMIDGSYLTNDEESVGQSTGITRGEDLLLGYSKSARKGPGLLYAGGSTIAAHTVERVGIAVMVERAQKGDTEWEFYDGWQKFSDDKDRISSNQVLNVEGGYYYRVRCIHSANSDVSSSFTNGVFIEKP